jgi:hypothetical protein
MSRNYFDRYQYFIENGEHKIVPGLEIPIKSTDRYHQYKKNKDRLDKISQEFYGSPTFGWLIMSANPSAGLNEFEINDNFILRIPFPLVSSLQDYKRAVELYNLYYGQ